MDKKELKVKAFGEPNTNIFYRNDTSDSESLSGNPEVSRITDLQDTAPDSGLNYKTNLNFDNTRYDQGNYYKSTVSGILKLDKKSPIWQTDDTLIKQSLVSKLNKEYPGLTLDSLDITINRQEGTIAYESKRVMSGISILSADRVEIPFQLLGLDELFYIEPQKLQAQYPGFARNKQWKNMGKWDRTTIWQKTDNIKFCMFEDNKKCITTELTLNDIGIEGTFKIDFRRAETLKYFAYMKGLLKREVQLDENKQSIDLFQKIDDKQFKLYTPLNNQEAKIVFAIKNPEILFVYFDVWKVEMDNKAVPQNAIPVGKIVPGGIFVLVDKDISEAAKGRYVPYNTQFIKMDNKTFMLWEAGKTDVDDLATIIEQWRTDQKTSKVQKNYIFEFDTRDPQYNDWDGNPKKISYETMVIPRSEMAISPRKKQTLDGILEQLIKSYPSQKDKLGTYIKIPIGTFEQEIGKANVLWDDVIKKSAPQTVEGLGEVLMGNTEKYSWIINEKDKTIIIQQ
jgi:hypothetical protein